MSTIELYKDKINSMSNYIEQAKTAVSNYCTDLSALKSKILGINSSVCDSIVSKISSSLQTQEQQIDGLEATQREVNDFIELTIKRDNSASSAVVKAKDEFYKEYDYLKPDSGKSAWEKFCDQLEDIGECCKELERLHLEEKKLKSSQLEDFVRELRNNVPENIVYYTGTLNKEDATYNDIEWKDIDSYAKKIRKLRYVLLGSRELKYKLDMEFLKNIAIACDKDKSAKSYLPSMFEKFYSGSGGIYTNNDLTEAVRNHKNTKEYIEKTKQEFINAVQNSNSPTSDDVRYILYNELGYKGKDFSIDASGNVSGLNYEFTDSAGLSLAIHDWNSKTIYVSDYSTDGNHFSGKLHYVFEDTFGLDGDDIKPDKYKAGLFPGFQAWYILQHDKTFNGKYKPFTTRVEIIEDFEGHYYPKGVTDLIDVYNHLA